MSQNNCQDEIRKSFWKTNNNAVPGKPRKEVNSKKLNSSFINYQQSVLDAWEIYEDVCVKKSPSRNFSRKVSLNDILKTHRSTSESSVRDKLDVDFKWIPLLKSRVAKNESIKTAGCDSKLARFKTFFQNPTNIEELRSLSWNGIPKEFRPDVWKMLSGLQPLNVERRDEMTSRKRLDYWNLVSQHYETRFEAVYKDTFHQIHIDVPRMNPWVQLFQQKCVQEIFERILFIWAIRHPASGYVQGINDLVTPFFLVFLLEYDEEENIYNGTTIEYLRKDKLSDLEADTFWCLSNFMNGIQDNYIYAQTGIQKNVGQLKELIQRIDAPLHRHLVENDVDYIQFSFRWFNNLLTRELSLSCIIRLWDTYLAEGDSFAQFMPYVCAAFLLYWRDEIVQKIDFQGLMVLLQNLPTTDWNDSHISLIVADAYRLKVMFADSPKHLQGNQ